MSEILGMECKAYRGDAVLASADAAGVAALTLTEMGNITDVSLSLETGSADTTKRGNNGWRTSRATLKDGSVECTMFWDSTDGDFAAIFAAWQNSSEIALLFLDGAEDVEGSSGLAANFVVTNLSRDESMEDVVKASVTFKPSSKVFWHTVPAA